MFWLSRRIFLLEDDYLIFYRKTKDSSMNYFVERWIKGKFRFQCKTVQINSGFPYPNNARKFGRDILLLDESNNGVAGILRLKGG